MRALRPWSHAAIGQDQRKPTAVIGRFALNEPLPRHRTCDRTRVHTTESGGKIQLHRGELARALCIDDLVGPLTVVLVPSICLPLSLHPTAYRIPNE